MPKKLLLEDIIDQLHETDGETLTLLELITLHEKLKVAKKYEKIVGDTIINRMVSGESTTGYVLTKTKPRAKIVDNEAVVIRLIDFISGARPEALRSISYGSVLQPKSLTDLKKLLGDELYGEMLSEYIETADEGDNYTYAKVEETKN